ncbi:MAG: SDR family oxidoreductase [Deltaproteobacteria bacterium]|nr:SDR family oxidoreductase [Deltaproteobacteria bacterium]NND28335.1 SDR family oxidoreductase [Myxococcales bacterium]MBT8466004.1 SDR family oxidoreductase [Deltaproteobacteria bacterium]MBT8480251.1 SDR family oxidoreductase [Deltaproteobacteria bacterium]NNK07938.1 SDR family oxidoreductase [Myxococcales bacterium]
MDQLYVDGLFSDEVVLITGGGTGIGRVAATEMGLLGAKIAICGRRPDPLQNAVSDLESKGIEAFGAPCDIREPEAIASYVDAVLERFGHIDVLINNAGGQFPTTAETLSPKGFAAVVRNNLIGTWAMTHAVANKAMIPRKRGRIVNVIAQIIRGFPGMVHTGAARAGVDNMTKTLAVEWALHGIRVNAVAPGVIVTSGTKQYPPALLDTAEKSNPLKRLGTAEEVSHLITYLASRYADFVAGQTFYIDGGASIWGDQWFLPEDVPKSPPYPVPKRG